MKILKKIISRFTMKHIETRFTDAVTGRSICLYKDRYGDHFLAAYPFTVFDMRMKKY